VRFYPQSGRFSADGAAPEGGGSTENARTGKVTASSLPAGISFAMLDKFHQDYAELEWVNVYFYPDGTCDETVIVLVGHGDQRKITLDYASGTPKVSDVDK
jgi:hypothetical protein